VSIALTNVLCFSGWSEAGRIVSDDVSFRRYFGNPDIAVHRQAPDGTRELLRTIGTVRDGAVSPEGFVEYLSNPGSLRVGGDPPRFLDFEVDDHSMRGEHGYFAPIKDAINAESPPPELKACPDLPQ
jgi:hypothetical protein